MGALVRRAGCSDSLLFSHRARAMQHERQRTAFAGPLLVTRILPGEQNMTPQAAMKSLWKKWAEGAQRVTRYTLLRRGLYTFGLGAPTWYIWQLPFCWGRSSVQMLIGIRQLSGSV
jgi:hypothetical protein